MVEPEASATSRCYPASSANDAATPQGPPGASRSRGMSGPEQSQGVAQGVAQADGSEVQPVRSGSAVQVEERSEAFEVLRSFYRERERSPGRAPSPQPLGGSGVRGTAYSKSPRWLEPPQPHAAAQDIGSGGGGASSLTHTNVVVPMAPPRVPSSHQAEGTKHYVIHSSRSSVRDSETPSPQMALRDMGKGDEAGPKGFRAVEMTLRKGHVGVGDEEAGAQARPKAEDSSAPASRLAAGPSGASGTDPSLGHQRSPGIEAAFSRPSLSFRRPSWLASMLSGTGVAHPSNSSARGASAPSGGRGVPLLNLPRDVESSRDNSNASDREPCRVHKVQVVTAEQEWGEGLGLSSSSDSDDWYMNRRCAAEPAHAGGVTDESKSGHGQQLRVEVRELDREWGGALGLSSGSSSESSVDVPRQRWRQQRGGGSASSAASVARPKGGDEAAGSPPASAEDIGKAACDADLEQEEQHRASRAPRQRERPPPAAAPAPSQGKGRLHGGSLAGGARAGRAGASPGPTALASPRNPVTQPSQKPICPNMQCRGFLLYSFVHILDCILRVSCVVVYYQNFGVRSTFFTELLLLGSGAFMSTYITFHDADVVLWMHRQPTWGRKFLIALAAFLFLGCFQLIQVKRAWARQLQSAEVLTEMGLHDGKEARQTPGSSKAKSKTAPKMPTFAGAERIMPVALLTGVPFLLVNHIWASECAFREKELVWAPRIITVANIFGAWTVSWAVADMDYEVSHHVWKRYHLRNKTKHRQLKKLFPMLHRLFRAAEVYFRMAVVTGLIVVFRRNGYLQEFFLIPVLFDYFLGVTLLNWNSPDKERNVVHFLAGVTMLLADLAHFVDRQNFASPARAISKVLLIVRSIEFVVCMICLSALAYYENEHSAVEGCLLLDFKKDIVPLLLSAILYHSIRFFFPLGRVGHDLHTAAAKGLSRRLKLLLQADRNGQVLDVNAASQDAEGMTPLMYAAESGSIEALALLLQHGARMDAKTEKGDTCLHFAARKWQVKACEYLVDSGADPCMTNNRGETPFMQVSRLQRKRSRAASLDSEGNQDEHPVDAELRRILLGPKKEAAETDKEKSMGGMSKPKTCQVPAIPTTGLHLRNLFPEVEEDDTPSPRVLQSVSALVVSRAAGGLARRVLARQDERGNGVPLGALRRVRELGRGGFGRVIEVELPRDASRSLWRRQQSDEKKRFALKLQLKRDQRQAHSEVLALRRADHPFIVHLERAFAFDKFFALLLELCPTDLNRKLCEEDEDGRCLGLTPFQTARYMGQVLLALVFLHEEEKIVFRDVKPENILISCNDEAKLTDFGLAKVVTSAERMTMCGTMGFLPPELTATGAARFASEMLHGGSSSLDGSEASGSDVSEVSARPPKTVGKPRRKGSGGSRSPFKIDTYALGVTMQLTLLGEEGGRKRSVNKKGPMMLPLHITEAENMEMLAQMRENGRLSGEAYDLLVDNLLCFDQKKRRRLSDPRVQGHAFFLQELGCRDLQEFLLERGKGSCSSGETSLMHRMVSTVSAGMVDSLKPSKRRSTMDRRYGR